MGLDRIKSTSKQIKREVASANDKMKSRKVSLSDFNPKVLTTEELESIRIKAYQYAF